jgi:indole-3-acetate monooxygenase
MPETARPLDRYLERIAEIAPIVREHAARSEQERRLAAPVVEALHASGLFRIMLMPDKGGGGLTVPDSLRVVEAVARLDASTGWNLSIGAGGALFAHYLPRASYDAVFAEPRALIAGSLNPLGTRAERREGGWLFNGRASYVSCSTDATWINVAGLEVHDGGPRMIDDAPLMRAAMFPVDRAEVLDTWHMAGMRGTGSNDVVFENVFVPDAYTYEWPNPRSPWQQGAFAVVPIITQLGCGLAATTLGAARHAIDAIIELATVKVPGGTRALMRDRPLMQQQLAQAEGLVQAGRAYLFDTIDDAWRRGEQGVPFDDAARATARLACVTATKLSAQAVDLIYDAAGMNGAQTDSELARAWRDVHTITQHVILGTGRYEIVGRVMLGLPAGFPII